MITTFLPERNRDMSSYTTVQLMVMLGFRPNVYPRVLVTVGVIELSAVDHPH